MLLFSQSMHILAFIRLPTKENSIHLALTYCFTRMRVGKGDLFSLRGRVFWHDTGFREKIWPTTFVVKPLWMGFWHCKYLLTNGEAIGYYIGIYIQCRQNVKRGHHYSGIKFNFEISEEKTLKRFKPITGLAVRFHPWLLQLLHGIIYSILILSPRDFLPQLQTF